MNKNDIVSVKDEWNSWCEIY